MEDKVQEVIDILGEQFTKLQISKALTDKAGDVDEAIELLLSLQNQAPVELFSEDIIAKDVDMVSPGLSLEAPQLTALDKDASLFFHVLSQSKQIRDPESDRKVFQVQEQLTSQVQGDFFNLIGVLNGFGQAKSTTQKVVNNAKIIFEESTPREFDFSVKAIINPETNKLNLSAKASK